GSPSIKYQCSNFSTKKTLTIVGGGVEIYVDGNVDLTGSTIINQGIPANLKIFVIGRHHVDLGGSSKLYAQVYAPESDVTIHGTPGFYGAIVGKSLDFRGTCDIHYDESSPPIDLPWKATLVK
ncbi:MAG: DUF7305 domain-containing protein, partial [Tepidisphaeraceae bacterium]